MPTETFFNLPADKRERFLTIAINEFADNNYHDASISRICREMEIAKGSFYQYFADKRDLYLYLITDLAVQEKQAMLGQIEIPDPQANLFERLRWMFKLQAQFNFAHPRLAEVGYRALYRDQSLRDEVLDNLRQQARVYYQSLIEQGQAEGSIRPEVDVAAATFFLTAVMQGVSDWLQQQLNLPPENLMNRQLSEAEWATANQLFDQILTLLQQGLGKDKDEG